MELIEEIIGGPIVPLPNADGGLTRRDKVRGMLLGVATGDALGAPHEFHYQTPLSAYTGRLEHRLVVVRRFQPGKKFGHVGMVTDDTEMMIALARAIANTGGYDLNTVVKEYLIWANSQCPFMGKNTRALFVGIKTIDGYAARHAALKGAPMSAWSQSNGCLMRCAPLAALPDADWERAAAQDCGATNFHPVCIGAVRAYLTAARALLAGQAAADASSAAVKCAATVELMDLRNAIVEGICQVPRDVTTNKGWVLHGIYCAFYALNDQAPTFGARVDRIVRLGGDTDTNAAIAGGLLGALFGESALLSETPTGSNIAAILSYRCTEGDLPRPERYAPARLRELADLLAGLDPGRP